MFIPSFRCSVSFVYITSTVLNSQILLAGHLIFLVLKNAPVLHGTYLKMMVTKIVSNSKLGIFFILPFFLQLSIATYFFTLDFQLCFSFLFENKKYKFNTSIALESPEILAVAKLETCRDFCNQKRLFVVSDGGRQFPRQVKFHLSYTTYQLFGWLIIHIQRGV